MDQVAQVREKIDIVSLISEYIPVKKAGRNFKANCPFHNETTPSFVISPERQIWHCFGCAKGGDSFTFLMEYEHIDFGESLRILAKKAGIELVQSALQSGISSKKEKLYALNYLSSEFYHYVLTKHSAGKDALTYLQGRAINEKILKTFKIGYAPRAGNVLSNYLISKKGYTQEDLIEAGLSYIKNGRIRDFFINRIIFPLIDQRDNIVGFSARALNNEVLPKYVNTKETLIYQKGSHLFGIQIAKNAIKKENHAIIMEGEFDVISSFQEGITNVLAVKGTALTEAHATLLARFSKRVSLCFDQDLAGREAIKRSILVLEKHGLTTSIILVPNGKDPDDAIKQNPTEFKIAVKNDINAYDYLLDQAIKTWDPKTSDGKKQISLDLLPFLNEISNEIIKEHYLKKLAQVLETSYESIIRELTKLKHPVAPVATKQAVKEKRSREEMVEEYLVSLIVQSEQPKQVLEKVVSILSKTVSKERAYQKILYHLLEFITEKNSFDGTIFSNYLPDELIPAYDKSLLLPLPQFDDPKRYEAEIEKSAKELRNLYLRGQIKEVTDKLKENEGESSDSVEELQLKLSELMRLLNEK